MKLSNKITRQSELKKLGTEGLRVNVNKIDRHITNNRDISSAAYDVLSDWRKSQENNTVAYKNICEALKMANME